MNLEKYLADNNCTLDNVMLYWCGDGHFIDYRPEMGRYGAYFLRLER